MTSSKSLPQRWLNQVRANDPTAWPQLIEYIRDVLAQVAQGIARRRGGSPDGFADASDLAQSVVIRVLKNPQAELNGVETSDELRGRLYQMLIARWIDRRRKEHADKRGGGRVIAASQMGDSNAPSPLDLSETPTERETTDLMLDLLEPFEPGSQMRQIVELLLAGYKQNDIAESLGLSRDAVGRRIRGTIVPTLQRRL
jgi:RNA polymerase sigma factor (sigma-70 family)